MKKHGLVIAVLYGVIFIWMAVPFLVSDDALFKNKEALLSPEKLSSDVIVNAGVPVEANSSPIDVIGKDFKT